MSDEKLLKQLEDYKQLAKENKNIDVGALMVNALQQQQANLLSKRAKRWGYLISLGFPPFGLFFAIYFWNSGKDDGRHAAYVCIALTVFIVVAFIVFFQVIASSAGVNLNQVQQIKPNDIIQLYQ